MLKERQFLFSRIFKRIFKVGKFFEQFSSRSFQNVIIHFVQGMQDTLKYLREILNIETGIHRSDQLSWWREERVGKNSASLGNGERPSSSRHSHRDHDDDDDDNNRTVEENENEKLRRSTAGRRPRSENRTSSIVGLRHPCRRRHSRQSSATIERPSRN